MSLFDLNGRLVWRALDAGQPAGNHEIVLESRPRLPGGPYLSTLEAGWRVATREMLVVE